MTEEQLVSLRIEAVRLAAPIYAERDDLDLLFMAATIYKFLLTGETPNE